MQISNFEFRISNAGGEACGFGLDQKSLKGGVSHFAIEAFGFTSSAFIRNSKLETRNFLSVLP